MERDIPLEPPRFLNNKHVQTIFTTIFPPKNSLRTIYENEVCILKTSDKSGDYLWLDHSPPIRSQKIKYNGYYLVLFHGMEGSSDSHYIVSLAETALLAGFGVMRVNLRGCGRGEGLSKKGYNAGLTIDFKLVEDYVYKNFSKNIIFAGFSLSANTLLKYLAEKNSKIKLFSAVSPPLDLKKACEFIDSRTGIFYRKVFLNSFQDKIERGVYTCDEKLKEKILDVDSMFDFDDIYTGPNFGFRGALDYYRASSSIYSIYKVKTPGIMIHAKDDPLIKPDVFNSINWKKLPHIKPILTDQGGHVGFITKKTEQIPNGKWLDFVLTSFYKLNQSKKN